jgi:hypothetical protein
MVSVIVVLLISAMHLEQKYAPNFPHPTHVLGKIRLSKEFSMFTHDTVF